MTPGQHAVVLGASMGGLLAARALSEHYDSVSIVERDILAAEPGHRRGVPQGRHTHALLPGGSEVLNELFPGLLDDLVLAGAPVFDYGDMSRVYVSINGHRLVHSGHYKDHVPLYFPSRPLLECFVRRRVTSIPNVAVIEGHDAVEPASDATKDRVTGVVVRGPGGYEQTLTADLVVDAMGRGARSPAFLESMGYDRPPEDHIGVRLVYSSQPVRLPRGMVRELAVLVSPVAGRPTGMALFRHEDDTWMFTLIGMVGREPPTDRDEMLAYAEDFAPSHVMAALRDAEPLADVARHRVPSSQWRRYDKLRRFPAGLLVFGDAICSFNPIYGQGMTVAALEALALRGCLRDGERDLARRYFGATAKAIRVAWQLAAGGDLLMPEVEAPRPLSMRLTHRYVEWLAGAMERDTIVAEQFSKVSTMLEAPSRLLRPALIMRAAAVKRRHRGPTTHAVEPSAAASRSRSSSVL